ncbi:MAG: DinB family protein [Chloroflexota bacterium]
MSEKKVAILEKLAAARGELLAFVAGLDEEAWKTAVFASESDDPLASWSALDILRHLVNAEWGMTGLMMNIQSGKGGVPEDFDRSRYNNRSVAKIVNKPPSELVASLEKNRVRLLAFIDTLSEEDWGKEGRHASLNIYTIEEICHIIADHERDHIKDIQQALS